MSHPEIEKLIADLAQSFVFVDWSDPAALAPFSGQFQDLALALQKVELVDETAHCQDAGKVVEDICGGAMTPDIGRGHLTAILNALQSCVVGDCSCHDAAWPSAPADVSSGASSRPVTGDCEGLVDNGIMSEFLSRQADVLDDIEKELLAVESGESAGDIEGINRFFHTLKGESALLGMQDVAELCHATEDMMQTEELGACIDRLLNVKDWFVVAFKHMRNEGAAPAPLAVMLAQLKKSGDSVPVGESTSVAPESAPDPAPVEPAVVPNVAAPEYRVVDYLSLNVLAVDLELVQDFVEESVEHLDASETHLLAIEVDPKDKEVLNAVFRGFHTIKGLAGFIEMEHIKDLAHKAENLLDMARRDELELTGNNMDLVFESVDMMKRLIEGLAKAMGSDGALVEENGLPSLMARLLLATDEQNDAVAAVTEKTAAVASPATVKKPTSGFIPLGKMKKKQAEKVAAPAVGSVAPCQKTPSGPASVAAPAEKSRPAAKANAPAKMKEAMRVDAERLDYLIETIGELVIAESMVSQSPEVKGLTMSVKLSKDLDHLDKICRELQEIGMSLRMVPVRPVFQKMARLVRDLAKKQDRPVEFVMAGEDTELDKNVVDKIGDPLVHMVRNSVDHGIEPDVSDRIKLGKPERGRVELRAFHKGGNICIEIEDDGRGLNKPAIRSKAIKQGMLREDEVISDRDLYMMIFEPGFSTAEKVTDISGRGVGMDVVRRNIEELHGTVDIVSEVGKGSTFTIKLPLTLAIIEGMVIMVGQEHYIIPTLSVVRLIRPLEKNVSHVFDKGEMLFFEDSHIPLFRLSGLFDVAEAKTEPHEAMVVVVEDEGRRIGLMADQLLGQQSIVIKSLGKAVQNTDGVAGGAIMSDGNVALILDVAGLVRVAHSTDTAVCRQIAAPKISSPAASLDKAVEAVLVDDCRENTAAENPTAGASAEPENSPVTVDA